MSKKQRYTVTARKIHGPAQPLERGAVVELTDEQYNSPFWRTRVQPAEALIAAVEKSEGSKKPEGNKEPGLPPVNKR